MAFLSRSSLFGVLLILASMPLEPAAALSNATASQADPGGAPAAGSIEFRLRRIAAAVREQEGVSPEEASSGRLPKDALSLVWGNGRGVGFANGGFRNGGFRNGGFYNGGFRNGGFYNGGFRNGGFGNGGFRNGGFYNRW
jgi:rSAM-associated Gly-rich repeat protein